MLRTAQCAGMEDERLRRFLRLSPDDWQQWLGFVADAPLPPRPALPLVLRHLGYLTARLARENSAYA